MRASWSRTFLAGAGTISYSNISLNVWQKSKSSRRSRGRCRVAQGGGQHGAGWHGGFFNNISGFISFIFLNTTECHSAIDKRWVRYKADHHSSAYDTLNWDNFIFKYILECLAKIKIVPEWRGAMRGGTAGGGVWYSGGGAGWQGRGCISECEVHLFGWGGGGGEAVCRRVGNSKLPVV